MADTNSNLYNCYGFIVYYININDKCFNIA